jgi:hypothetical protein
MATTLWPLKRSELPFANDVSISLGSWDDDTEIRDAKSGAVGTEALPGAAGGESNAAK